MDPLRELHSAVTSSDVDHQLIFQDKADKLILSPHIFPSPNLIAMG